MTLRRCYVTLVARTPVFPVDLPTLVTSVSMISFVYASECLPLSDSICGICVVACLLGTVRIVL